MSKDNATCCVMILNYNGIEHVDDCITTIASAVARASLKIPIVMIDNSSTDNSVCHVRNNYPYVEIINAYNNFLFSYNDAITSRSEDIVILLNNDMKFDVDFIEPLLKHFSDDNVFAVGSRIKSWDGSRDTVGRRYGKLHRFWFYKWWDYDHQQSGATLEACGGAIACRRTKFIELGGFDDLYRPGYYEDMDLSYRALERGWSVYYEPASVCYHKESASMNELLRNSRKARLLYRNHLLFTVKNIGGWSFLAGFMLVLPIRVIKFILLGYMIPVFGLIDALPLFAKALRRRLNKPKDLLSTEDIVNRPNSPQPIENLLGL